MNRYRIIASSVILIICIILTSFGINSFIKDIGFMSAGFLFGMATNNTRLKESAHANAKRSD